MFLVINLSFVSMFVHQHSLRIMWYVCTWWRDSGALEALRIVISLSKIRDRDVSYTHHVIWINNQCCPCSNIRRATFMLPGNSTGQHDMSAECGSCFLFSVIQQNKYWLLASINTEKLCPLVMQCSLGPLALGQHFTTSGHNFSVLTSAPVNIRIMCYINVLLIYLLTWIKLGTNIYHVSGHCWKCFRSRRSVITKSKQIAGNNLLLLLLLLLLRGWWHTLSHSQCEES